MRLTTKGVVALVLAALAATALCASVSFTPPGGQKMYVASLPLQATGAAGKATASVTVVCKTDLSTGMLTIQATGLEPGKAYTAWLVKPGAKGQPTKTGLGKSPYALTVNAKGFGNLMADLPNCKQAVMHKLEIDRHTGKDPKDLKGSTAVFTADLSKMLEGKKP